MDKQIPVVPCRIIVVKFGFQIIKPVGLFVRLLMISKFNYLPDDDIPERRRDTGSWISGISQDNPSHQPVQGHDPVPRQREIVDRAGNDDPVGPPVRNLPGK